MSSPVFVRDAQGTPLMPTSAAYARRLLQRGKARWVPHHAFSIIQLSQVVTLPVLRPVLAGIRIHLHTAEILLVASGERGTFPLLHLVLDLRTDLPTRIRRRAKHRHHRRARGRYRSMRRYGQPFKLRRPSLARSAWGRVLRPRLRRRRGPSPSTCSPIIRWRAQAITRVFTALAPLLPISHALILSLANGPEPNIADRSIVTLHQQLIAAYGQITADGRRVAMCAYCGTTNGRIEAEHILPIGRGGTDGWNNRVLACATCNARKGNRTPEEAGMSLLIQRTEVPAEPNRAGVYARWTARELVVQLHQHQIAVVWPRSPSDWPTELPVDAFNTLMTLVGSPQVLPLTIAKPIARPVKQIFSSRNYPLSTQLRLGFVRVRHTVKRRIRVNRGLAIISQGGQRRVRVVPVGAELPEEAIHVIIQGMLCEGQRNQQLIVGIVTAIHSSGRLTLLVPASVRTDNINWRRVVVSPRQHLRVLSTDRVLFVRVLSPASDVRDTVVVRQQQN
jgi:hypothetical protein